MNKLGEDWTKVARCRKDNPENDTEFPHLQLPSRDTRT